MNDIQLVYVAGPFSAPKGTPPEEERAAIEANIDRAELLAIEVAKLGAMPVCPHTNTRHPLFCVVQPYQFWIDGTLRLLETCDALIVVPGWEQSSGARGEVEFAKANAIPVFHDLDQLKSWLEAQRG